MPPKTKKKAKKQGRNRSFCFTHNNHSDADIQNILTLEQDKNVEVLVVQAERGEEKGTPHLQGVVKFKNAKTLSAAKKLLGKVHITVCRNLQASITYCSKAAGRIKSICNKGKPEELRVIKNLRPWQRHLLDVVEAELKEPNDRIIHWVYDNGNTGKTAFIRYLMVHFGAILLGGKGSDAKCAVALCVEEEIPIPIVIWALPRAAQARLDITGLEEISDGTFFSYKYKPGPVLINSPQTWVFANYEPDESRFTPDRLQIINTDELILQLADHERRRIALAALRELDEESGDGVEAAEQKRPEDGPRRVPDHGRGQLRPRGEEAEASARKRQRVADELGAGDEADLL